MAAQAVPRRAVEAGEIHASRREDASASALLVKLPLRTSLGRLPWGGYLGREMAVGLPRRPGCAVAQMAGGGVDVPCVLRTDTVTGCTPDPGARLQRWAHSPALHRAQSGLSPANLTRSLAGGGEDEARAAAPVTGRPSAIASRSTLIRVGEGADVQARSDATSERQNKAPPPRTQVATAHTYTCSLTYMRRPDLEPATAAWAVLAPDGKASLASFF
ncbi:hypothetical protein CDD83_10601 [Cordyceps sp. RAO-2017]|nr:hypothetical protein CDD83_10601 [Cordyceps sp. RAO-2017]